MTSKNNQSGFTLLEIALVLIISGLLIGAVLNSRGINDAAKFYRLEKQVEELNVAVNLYFDRMNHLPSDGTGNSWTEDLLDEELISSESKANTHPFGDSIDFTIDSATANHPFTGNTTIFQYDNIPAKWARSLIASFEDSSSPETGNIRATETSAVQTPLTAANLDAEVTAGNDLHVFVRY